MAKDKRTAVKPARKAPGPAKPSSAGVATKPPASRRAPGAALPVVGIGASAGGLEEFDYTQSPNGTAAKMPDPAEEDDEVCHFEARAV